jgi:hypothetical protein
MRPHPKNDLQSGVFSMEELEIARGSSWYRHIDFSALLRR